MNSITHNGQSHDFATTDEFLALPIVRKFTDDPAFTHLANSPGQLQACKKIEGQPVMHVVGQLKEPVVLPKILDLREPG